MSVGILSGSLKTFESSYADCHLLDADPSLTWFKSSDASLVSAKTGQGVDQLLEKIVLQNMFQPKLSKHLKFQEQKVEK